MSISILVQNRPTEMIIILCICRVFGRKTENQLYSPQTLKLLPQTTFIQTFQYLQSPLVVGWEGAVTSTFSIENEHYCMWCSEYHSTNVWVTNNHGFTQMSTLTFKHITNNSRSHKRIQTLYKLYIYHSYFNDNTTLMSMTWAQSTFIHKT